MMVHDKCLFMHLLWKEMLTWSGTVRQRISFVHASLIFLFFKLTISPKLYQKNSTLIASSLSLPFLHQIFHALCSGYSSSPSQASEVLWTSCGTSYCSLKLWLLACTLPSVTLPVMIYPSILLIFSLLI